MIKIGLHIFFAFLLCFYGGCAAPPSDPIPLPPSGDESLQPFPRVEIWLDKDHTVNRSAILNNNGNLCAWVVLYNGRQVLSRNAASETQFRYFKQTPGVYTIYVHQGVDGMYRVISNIVSYQIKEESNDG